MGTLRDSIHHLVKDWDEVHVGSSRVSYAAAVEFGSVPHAPPFEPIARWAKRKGLPKAAWPIWQKIREEGTQPHPFMRPAIHRNHEKIAQLLKQAMRDAAKETPPR